MKTTTALQNSKLRRRDPGPRFQITNVAAAAAPATVAAWRYAFRNQNNVKGPTRKVRGCARKNMKGYRAREKPKKTEALSLSELPGSVSRFAPFFSIQRAPQAPKASLDSDPRLRARNARSTRWSPVSQVAPCRLFRDFPFQRVAGPERGDDWLPCGRT